ncbi:NAD(P)/FAD-dependent oxidoreductase [Plastorhodobacter daqingensis]|uniref:NAD(P)/FAD-dependent oxidoreductase n=1 Tax=Plastorhodobacter daqingensis TaxID=1387281 RepID=A0ABW2UK11_9RHOB
MQLYESPAYDPAWPDSHWAATSPAPPPCPPLTGAARSEVAVIGAGYAGLSAARALAQAGVGVTVLEAVQPGWGASGRNGGFCCMGGSKLDDAALVRRFGPEAARRFHRFQQEAVSHVATLLQEEEIDADRGPDGEMLLAHRPAAWAALQRQARERAQLHGERLVLLSPAELAARGIAGAGFHGGLFNPVGFPLHPLKYLRGLARAAQRAGATICGDSPVSSLRPSGGGWQLTTPQGSLQAGRVLIATNGYGADDLPPWLAARRLPVLSAVFTTRPLSEAERAAQGWTSETMSFDSRALLHYFRLLPDGRFLFGMRGGTSARPAALAALHAEARRHFAALFPAWADVAVERHWSGLACLTGSLAPFAGPVPGAPGLFAALGWHGNGVSTASLAGARIAQEILGQTPDLPGIMRHPPRRFPLPFLRRPLLALGYRVLALKDGPLPRPGQAACHPAPGRG